MHTFDWDKAYSDKSAFDSFWINRIQIVSINFQLIRKESEVDYSVCMNATWCHFFIK